MLTYPAAANASSIARLAPRAARGTDCQLAWALSRSSMKAFTPGTSAPHSVAQVGRKLADHLVVVEHHEQASAVVQGVQSPALTRLRAKAVDQELPYLDGDSRRVRSTHRADCTPRLEWRL